MSAQPVMFRLLGSSIVNAFKLRVGNWQHLLLLLCVAAYALLVRRLTLKDIELGGDATEKWFFVRQWFWDNDFSHARWNHHMARIGVNIWAFLSQWFFGSEAWVYYVAPVGAATLQAGFTFSIAKRLAGNLAGVVAAFLLITFPPMARAGSQLLPGVFSGLYVVVSIYLLLRYWESTSARRVWVSGLALSLFAAYLTKVPNVFFYPGFVFGIWVAHRDRRDVGLLLGILAVLLVCETAFYAATTEYWNRLDIILSSHLPGKGKPVSRGLAIVWDRYTRLPTEWKVLFFSFLLALWGTFAFAKDKRIRVLCGIVAVFFVFKTFALRSISPVRLLEPLRPRYLMVAVPLMCTVIGVFVSLAVQSMAPWAKKRCAPCSAAICIAVLLLLGVQRLDKRGAWAFERNQPFAKLAKRSRIVADAYRRRLPIIRTHKSSRKAMKTVWRVYLPDELLVQNNLLPSYKQSVAPFGKVEWFSAEPNRYLLDAKRKAKKKKKCVLKISRRKGKLRLRPYKVLPSSCRGKAASLPIGS